MLLSQLLTVLDQIAPPQLAESWDNVGLLAGDPAGPVSAAMLTIDYTRAVAGEARALNCDAIISYHPPIFEAVKRINSGSLIFDAIRRGVAIYSPHTALDVADGGTNDMLADAVGLAERSPLRATPPNASEYKLVTFVPENDLPRVADALFDAGAGQIGQYSRCSFRSPGTGTFLGSAATNPTVGQAGAFEQAAEMRLETIVPIDRLSAVVAALKSAHPYEEPAFDLLQLAARPQAKGQGRIGPLAPTPRSDVFARIKTELGLSHLLIAGPTDGIITRAAVCAGACGDHLNDALAQKAELYLTGEMRHHDALKAAQAGMTVVCTLHSNSERAILKRVAKRISEALPQLAVHVSQVDRDPFAVM